MAHRPDYLSKAGSAPDTFGRSIRRTDRALTQVNPMKLRYELRGWLARRSAGLLLLVSLSSPVVAQRVGIGTSAPTQALDVVGNVQVPATNDYRYATPRTEYLSLPPGAFTVGNTGLLTGTSVDGNERWVHNGTFNAISSFFAPLNLPNGAIIQNCRFYVIDRDPTYGLVGLLYRLELATGTTASIGNTGSSAGTTGYQQLPATLSPAATTIDNERYAYYLRVLTGQANTDLKFSGARVEYTVGRVD
jgi:hypothetical protein